MASELPERPYWRQPVLYERGFLNRTKIVVAYSNLLTVYLLAQTITALEWKIYLLIVMFRLEFGTFIVPRTVLRPSES